VKEKHKIALAEDTGMASSQQTSNSSSQTALITGGAGFIGSHLADRLLKDNIRITIVDDLSTGRMENIAHLKNNPNVRIIVDSVLNETLISELIAQSDRVYHLASAVGVKLIMEQPVKTIETIFMGTHIVLSRCAKHKKPVLLTSSSEVYGKGVAVPFREDDDVLTGSTKKHRWAYACAKSLDEFLALAHFKESGLPVSIVRLFNTVGPRQCGQYGMVLPRFVEWALKGQPLTVHGDGQQRRCFAHVADIVEALAKTLQTPACFGEVINIGCDEEISVGDLARMIVELTKSKSEVRFIPYEQAYGADFEDMRRRIPVLEKAQRILGYRPTRDLKTIILDVAKERGQGSGS
jgi:UDP-glucose 4-epimerase